MFERVGYARFPLSVLFSIFWYFFLKRSLWNVLMLSCFSQISRSNASHIVDCATKVVQRALQIWLTNMTSDTANSNRTSFVQRRARRGAIPTARHMTTPTHPNLGGASVTVWRRYEKIQNIRRQKLHVSESKVSNTLLWSEHRTLLKGFGTWTLNIRRHIQKPRHSAQTSELQFTSGHFCGARFGLQSTVISVT